MDLKSIFYSKNNTNKNKKKMSFQYNNTSQKTVPYKVAYDNGLFEISENVFSKTYKADDASFLIASQQVQDDMFSKFTSFLNSFNPEMKLQITSYNRTVDPESFAKNVLMKDQGDKFDVFRKEHNDVMLKNLSEGRNNIRKEIYFTVTIEATGYGEACSKFAFIDGQLDQNLKPINMNGLTPLSYEDRLSLLFDIYHPTEPGYLSKTAVIDGKEVKAFSSTQLEKSGTSTKDVVAPSVFIFNANNFQIGETFGQTLFLQVLPDYLSTDFINDISSLPYNMLSTVHVKAIEQSKAVSLISNNLVSIDSGIIEKQRKASRSGYSPDLAIPHKMRESKEQAEKMLGDIHGRNQKLFYITFIVTHFAENLNELAEQEKQIKSTAQKHLVNMQVLNSQQEYGLNASIPLGINKLTLDRLVTSEGASLFIPFSTKELFDPNGVYYGVNCLSKNIVMYNRSSSKNGNGVYLGTSGSGKSFAAKREIKTIRLSTPDTIMIVDPEGEFTPMGKAYDGEVIEVSLGSNVFINPMDMDLDYGAEGEGGGQDPVTLKADFIISICETMMGGKFGLSVTQKSIIDRCTRKCYEPYIQYMQAHPELGTIDRSKMPTLKHLYNEILKQPEPEAKIIALGLERYVSGSFDIFAHRTNVDTTNRLVIYNIKNVGKGLMELATQICLNDIWNRTIANHKKGIRTWFYVDEFYLLVQTPSSVAFLQEIWKRARKWGGIPTGITQNVSDLFTSQAASTIISNSDFVLMFNQAPADRANVAKMFNISPTQLSFITNSPAGQGLLYNGSSIIPIEDHFPKDTLSYAAMTSSMAEQGLRDKLYEKLAEINGEA